MALTPCPECKREISTDAKTCPHCGKPIPQRGLQTKWRALPSKEKNKVFAVAIVLVIILVMQMSFGGTAKEANKPAPASSTAQTSTPRPTHSEAQLDATLAAVKKRDKVLSAAWDNKSLPSLLVGVNGAGKVPGAFDGYARGICGALAAEGVNGAFVHVLDNNASGWVELGKAECPER